MAKRRVAWTAPAREDLLQIVDFIADEDPNTAERILEQLLSRAASLGRMAERGRLVPELRSSAPVRRHRELIVRPWRMIYVIENDGVYVTAVFDSRRDIARLLHDRFARGGKVP